MMVIITFLSWSVGCYTVQRLRNGSLFFRRRQIEKLTFAINISGVLLFS